LLGADLGLHSSYASAAKFAKLEWLQTTFRHIFELSVDWSAPVFTNDASLRAIKSSQI